MIRILSGSAVVFLLALFTAGCANTDELTPEDTVIGPDERGGDGNSFRRAGDDVSGRRPGTRDTDRLSPSDVDGLQPRDGSMSLLEGDAPPPIESIYFGYDEYNIRAGERPKLEAVARQLQDDSGATLVLEGHTSWRGTAAYNIGLGDRRANAVRDYLANLGLDRSRIEAISRGETEAVQDIPMDDPRAEQDRRVDIRMMR